MTLVLSSGADSSVIHTRSKGALELHRALCWHCVTFRRMLTTKMMFDGV